MPKQPQQCNHLAYAPCDCENCGKVIEKSELIVVEEDLPFCSERCADIYFERYTPPKETEHNNDED